MKAKEDRVGRALEILQSPGAIFKASTGNWIVKSMSKPGRTYVVGIKNQTVFCSCPDYEIHGRVCKHALAATGSPALCLITQLRWATEPEELDYILNIYAEQVKSLPESIRSLARAEYRAAAERLTTSAAVAA